jgi:membrane protein YqaA with SNARE-associated domain
MVELLGGLFVASAVSGVVPIVNAELLVVTAAATLPVLGVPIVALVSTLGQMSSKTSLFALARWAPTRLPARGRSLLERASLTLSKREGAVGSVVFTSAATGLPPFYGVSLASGAVGMRMSAFVLTGSAGRFLRFSALAWFGRGLGSSTLESVHGLALALPFVGG